MMWYWFRGWDVGQENKTQITMKNEMIRIGQIEVRFLLESAETNGSLAMFEFTVPVGARVPMPHSHERYDETIYGLEGVITFTEWKGRAYWPWRIVFYSARRSSRLR